MGKGKLTLKTVMTDYSYENGNIVQGNIKCQADDKKVIEHSGSVYKPNESGQIGEMIGSFRGVMRGDEMRYSLSEMTLDNQDVVKAAIREVEPLLIPTQTDANQ